MRMVNQEEKKIMDKARESSVEECRIMKRRVEKKAAEKKRSQLKKKGMLSNVKRTMEQRVLDSIVTFDFFYIVLELIGKGVVSKKDVKNVYLF